MDAFDLLVGRVGASCEMPKCRASAACDPAPVWLVFVVVAATMTTAVEAFCPSLCQCNDQTLESHCVAARLDVVPNLLNPALRRLKLTHNRITNIYQSLGFYADLEALDLSHNVIGSLGQRNLEAQGRLRHLNVSHNVIMEVEPMALVGLERLEVLNLSHNQLTSVDDRAFQHLHALIDLDLSWNRLERLSDKVFSSLHKLQRLRLDSNRLELVPSPTALLPLASLLHLDLSSNRIAQMDGQGLSSLVELRQLNMSNNTVHHIHFAALDGLEHLLVLDLSANRLEYVPGDSLAAVANLRSLDLSANYMVGIDAADLAPLSHLEILRVSDVPTLRHIDGDALLSLNGSLSSLIMSGNAAWSRLEPRLISQLKALRYADLSANGFQTVAPIQWPASLEFFDLSANPLECNCSMHWLWRSHLHPSTANSSLDAVLRVPMKDIMCQGPQPLLGQNLFQLDETHLRCWNMAYVLLISVVSVLLLIVGVALLALCCWRSRRSSHGRSPPSHVKHLTNHMSHAHAGLHHHHLHHHHHQPANHLTRGAIVAIDCDSPPLKSKTLSLPKTVDYFLSDDDYVYHTAVPVAKPIPVTAV